MNDSTTSLPWLVIRQDDNGNRYRVGRYATRGEAQETADSLDGRGHKQLYWVERVGQAQGPPQRHPQTPHQAQTPHQTQPQAQVQNGDSTLN
ncbi:hypothetical protein [Streptomyces sp. LUP30]|uniref:hypothetical protein n=1 Tax=Streptomyces sp. LUP30 TaxID=1890285 RepID=UPI000851E286|nr:hypothetical protein [Streptomyces sp. LUP30]